MNPVSAGDIISITDGRKHLGEYVDLVKYQKRVFLFGKHGKAEAMLIALPEMNDALPLSAINAASPSFGFLAEEPDLYSRKDLRKRYD